MFSLHHLGLDREKLRGGWAPGYTDHKYDAFEADVTDFANAMAEAVMKDLVLLQKGDSHIGPSN